MPDLDGMSDEQLQGLQQSLRAKQAAAEPPPLPKAADLDTMSDEQLSAVRQQLRQKKLAPYIQDAVQEEAKAERTQPWSRERLMNPGLQHNYLMRQVFKVSQPIHDYQHDQAMAKFNRGEASEDDLRLIAKRQLQEHLDAQRSGGEKLAGGVMAIPGQVAEIMAGGRLASAAGAAGTELAGGAQAAAAIPSAVRFAGTTAAQAALTPNLGPAAVMQQNREAGRDPLDMRGVAPGMAKAMAEAAVLHGAGKVWSKVLPTSTVAGGYAVAGLTGPISQQVTDLTTYTLGLNSRYGRLQDIAEGKYGEAASASLLEMLTFGALHSAHGGEAAESKKLVDDGKAVLDVYAKAGIPADTAAADLTKIHARITRMRERGMMEDRAGPLFRDIPEGPLRDYADRLAGLSLESPPVGQAGARQRGPGTIPPPAAGPAEQAAPTGPGRNIAPPVAESNTSEPAGEPARSQNGRERAVSAPPERWTDAEKAEMARGLGLKSAKELDRLPPATLAELERTAVASRNAPRGPQVIRPIPAEPGATQHSDNEGNQARRAELRRGGYSERQIAAMDDASIKDHYFVTKAAREEFERQHTDYPDLGGEWWAERASIGKEMTDLAASGKLMRPEGKAEWSLEPSRRITDPGKFEELAQNLFEWGRSEGLGKAEAVNSLREEISQGKVRDGEHPRLWKPDLLSYIEQHYPETKVANTKLLPPKSEAARQPQEGPQQPQGGPIAPTPPTAPEAAPPAAEEPVYSGEERRKPGGMADVKLGPARAGRHISGEPLNVHQLLDAEGKSIGDTRIMQRDKDLHVEWIGMAGAAPGEAVGKLGRAGVKSLLKQLAAQYPDAETVSGLRVSGARTGASKSDQRTRMPLRRGERKVAEPAKMPPPEAPLPRTTEDLQTEIGQHGEALDAAALFERVAQAKDLTPQERHVLLERLGDRSVRDISKDPQLSGLKGDRAAAYLEKKGLGKVWPGLKSIEAVKAQEREGRKQRMTEAGAGVGREEAEQQGGGVDPRTVGADVSDLAAMHEELEQSHAEEEQSLKELLNDYAKPADAESGAEASVRRGFAEGVRRATADAEALAQKPGTPPGPAAPAAGPAEAPAAGPESAANPPADAGGGPAGGDLVSRNLFGQPIPKRFASVPGQQQRLGQGRPDIPYSGGEWMDAAKDLAAEKGLKVEKTEQPNVATIGGKKYRVEFVDNDWKLTPDKETWHPPLLTATQTAAKGKMEKINKDKGISLLTAIRKLGGLDEDSARNAGLDVEAIKESPLAGLFRNAAGKKGTRRNLAELADQLGDEGHTEPIPEEDKTHPGDWLLKKLASGVKSLQSNQEARYAKEFEAYHREAAEAASLGHAPTGAAEVGRAFFQAGEAKGAGGEVEDIAREAIERELHGLGDAAEPAGGSGDFDPGEFEEPGQPGTVVPKRGEPVSPLQQLAEDMAKNELPAGTAGSFASPLLLKAQEWATERIKKNVQTVADETAKLAGQMFPATTRLDRESGEATARFVAARTWAKYAAPDYIDRVMGPKATEQQRRAAGAVVTEMHLRHTKQAYIQRADELAAEARAASGQKAVDLRNQELEARQIARDVKSVVGVPGSPLKAEADYQAGAQSPFVKDVIARWKAEFAPVINDLYRRGQGIDANDPIDSFTQIEDFPVNLKAVGPNDPSTPSTVATGGSRGNLTNPRQKTSVFANQRKGNAPAYDIDLGAMIENSLARGAEVAAKREMYDTLQKNGLAERGEPGLAGEGHERLPGVFRGPKPDLYVHEGVMPELRQALAPDKPFGRIPLVTAALTKASLLSTVELAYHAKNQLTFLMKPGVRPTDLFNNAVGYLRGSPEVRARLTELARIGAMKPPGMEAGQLLPGKYRQFDPTYWSGKLLDGIGNVMRLTAADAFDRLAGNKPDLIYDAIAKITGVKPEAVNTETAKRDFINQLGQYEKRAQNKLVVLLRDIGIGPFATAGTNYYAQGIRGLTMNPGVHSESLAGQGLMRGETLLKTMAVLGSVALANYLAWGRVDGDDRTPAGAIKLGQQGDKTISYDMADIIGLKRGMRATGLLALTEGERRGDREGKVLDKAVDDAFLAAAHPAMGPPVQFGYTAKTGKDLTGRAVAPHAKAKESQTGLNLEAALRQANPPTHAIVGDATQQGQKETAAEKWNRLLGPFGVKFRPTPKKK